jgi:hypothetical protein
MLVSGILVERDKERRSTTGKRDHPDTPKAFQRRVLLSLRVECSRADGVYHPTEEKRTRANQDQATEGKA